MKYRKLRIAWSIVWGILCLLLVVLWVRSYIYIDRIIAPPIWPSGFSIESDRGRVAVYIFRDGFYVNDNEWNINHWLVKDFGWDAGPQWQFTQLRSGVLKVIFPHWVPAVLAVLVGGLAWLPWRFSLRTLLIGMTVAAIGLGCLIYSLRS